MECRSHWESIYKTKDFKQVSWYVPHLTQSLSLILSTKISKESPIIDIGGGVSTLVDDLLKEGLRDITILDISSKALGIAKKRLGKGAKKIKWIMADITTAKLLQNHYTLWHDRAVFHFLTQSQDRRAYVNQLNTTLKEGGHVILSTFSLKGPEHCSGLDIVRYNPEKLAVELGENFKLIKCFGENHQTPFRTTQAFVYCHFIKK